MSGKNNLSDDLMDLTVDVAEPIVDDLAVGIVKKVFGADIKALAEETSAIKVGIFVRKVFDAGVHYWQARKLQVFVNAVKAGNVGLANFDKLDDVLKQDLRAFVISELDKQTSDTQAKALGYLFVAYLQSKIDRLLFTGVGHELKSTNPMVFALNADGFTIEEVEGQRFVKGPLHYLPQAFLQQDQSNGVTSGPRGMVLTDLGIIFFEEVYGPMSKHV